MAETEVGIPLVLGGNTFLQLQCPSGGAGKYLFGMRHTLAALDQPAHA